jgi:3-dehydroquinate synthase
MKKVKVPLADRSYEIRVGQGLIDGLGPACRRLKLGRRCVVITDETVAPLYGAAAVGSLRGAGFEPFLIPVAPGEKSKSLRVVHSCYDLLARERLERNSFVVALGGGVVGDLAGFVAATYLRGVGFVQVPTTLLAQVDSSVGGKVGVNLRSGKNLVGAFYQPRLVLCDLNTLQTLPQRQLKAGLAEVIKYGIIADARLFARLEKDLPKLLQLDPRTLATVVARCCEIKADVVGQDEKEGGYRAILNYGHTIGHAIENSAGYGSYLHGEAISIGQVAASYLSQWRLGFSSSEVNRVRQLFEAAGLPVQMNLTAARREKLLAAMKLDKKVSRGQINFVLAESIGKVQIGQTVPERDLHKALHMVEKNRT